MDRVAQIQWIRQRRSGGDTMGNTRKLTAPKDGERDWFFLNSSENNHIVLCRRSNWNPSIKNNTNDRYLDVPVTGYPLLILKIKLSSCVSKNDSRKMQKMLKITFHANSSWIEISKVHAQDFNSGLINNLVRALEDRKTLKTIPGGMSNHQSAIRAQQWFLWPHLSHWGMIVITLVVIPSYYLV